MSKNHFLLDKMSSIVELIIEAEQTLVTGPLKKKWVLSQLPDSVDKLDAGVIIDDLIAVLNCPDSVKLFNDTTSVCLRWCCRK